MGAFEYREGVESIRRLSSLEALFTMHKPTLFHIPGRDHSEAVLISTLLHGREPAGFHAFLSESRRNESYSCDVYFLVGSVEAAQTQVEGKYFSERDIPGAPQAGMYDFNRYWGNTPKEWLANEKCVLLQERADALKTFFSDIHLKGFLDIHSYLSPSILAHGCVANLKTETKEAMSVLASKAFLVDFHLGTLLEYMAEHTTAVLIESGVNRSPYADSYAYRNLQKFFRHFRVKNGLRDQAVCKNWYVQGINFKISSQAKVAWQNNDGSADLILREDIEQLNHTTVPSGTLFGLARSLDVLVAKDPFQRKVEDYFSLQEGKLVTKRRVIPNFLNAQERQMKSGGFYFFEELGNIQ